MSAIFHAIKRGVKEAIQEIGPIQVDLAQIESVKIADSTGTVINPATEETVSGIKSKTDQLTFSDGKVNVLAHGIDDLGTIRPLLTDSNGRLKAIIENAELLVALSALEDSVEVYGRDYTNDVVRSIAVDAQGRVRGVVENTVSVSGSVSVTSELAYDSAADLKKVSVERDNVGLAKETTQAAIRTAVESIDSKVATEATLSQVAGSLIDTVESKSVADLTREIRDAVATETTLQAVRDYLYDTVEGKPLAVLQRENKNHVRSIDAYHYDFTLRRSGGRLLAVVDWRVNSTKFDINEWDLGLVTVEGASSYSIVELSAEGIPAPEGDSSPYVLKIIVPASGTVYVRVPVKASAFSVFVAYTTIYAKDYEVEASLFVTLGGNIYSVRNKPPKRWRVLANTWARFTTHWFMELHHGTAEVDLELYNPQSTDVVVYIGIFVAGEIKENIKCFGLLVGCEGGYAYIPLNAETFDWSIDIMLPMSFADCAHLQVWLGIESTDGTTVSGEIYLNGVLIASGSTTSSTTVHAAFKYLFARSGVYGHPTLSLRFVVNASGSAKINYITVVFYGFSDEFQYSKYIETTVPAGSTSTLIDFSNDVKHVSGGCLEVAAPTDGDIRILANTPEGEIEICRVQAGTTKEVTIHGRYLYIKAQNTSSSNSATVRASIYISDAFLPR